MAEKSWLDAIPSRTAFIFGLILGGGGMALIALVAVLSLLLKGGSLEMGSRTAPTVNAPTAYYPTEDPGAGQPTGPVEVSITDKDHIRGNKDAKVTVVEFSDFECPFCQRFAPSVKQALDQYGDKIRFVYKHFPLDSIHPQARPAAEASECAAAQGKFWEFHDALFANQDQLSSAYYPQLAQELGLNVTNFNKCLTEGTYRQKVQDDYQAGVAAGVRGTPHTLVNGIAVSGAVPFETLAAQIDAALAQ